MALGALSARRSARAALAKLWVLLAVRRRRQVEAQLAARVAGRYGGAGAVAHVRVLALDAVTVMRSARRHVQDVRDKVLDALAALDSRRCHEALAAVVGSSRV